MKVIHQSTDILIIQIRPIFIWIIGVIFAFVGLSIIAFLGKETIMTCSRFANLDGVCAIKETGILGVDIKKIPLKSLHGAEVESSTDSEGDTTYRVILKTNRGNIDFSSYSSSGYSEKEYIASNINNFVKNTSQQTVTVEQDERIFIYLFGGVFALLGLIIVLLVSQVTCFFDNKMNKLIIIKQTLLSKKYFEYELSDIVDVTVEESYSSDSGPTYRVALIQASGEPIPLTLYYSSGCKDKQMQAKVIKDYLNSIRSKQA